MYTFQYWPGKIVRGKGVALAVLLVAGGCAHNAQVGDVNDPFEPYNRRMQVFNDTVDRYTLKPLAQAYTYIFPGFFRKAIDNAFTNLAYPTVFVNQFLQGKWQAGFGDLGRFLINSTAGLAGLFDVAARMGLEKHEEDFGQTFAVWGWGKAPYFIVPFLGPVTVRDGLGYIPAIFTYPPTYIDDNTARWAMFGAAAIVERARLLDEEELVTGDRYLFIRDAYLQRRQHLITDGLEVDDPFLED